MTLTDPIAQGLNCIKNGYMAKKTTVDIPASKLLGHILEVLKREDFIDNFKLLQDTRQGNFRIYLKYDTQGNSVITGIKRVSRPGLRVYVRNNKIPRVLRGFGMAILSTSAGLMTDKEARLKKKGGEVICYIW
ncbi:MAG: 30S ribosomal protein S8 [Candidatus Omnitrophota bacterium]